MSRISILRYMLCNLSCHVSQYYDTCCILRYWDVYWERYWINTLFINNVVLKANSSQPHCSLISPLCNLYLRTLCNLSWHLSRNYDTFCTLRYLNRERYWIYTLLRNNVALRAKSSQLHCSLIHLCNLYPRTLCYLLWHLSQYYTIHSVHWDI